MIKTTAVIVGAGHVGLAMSRRLTERSIDHVVLERGEVANSWQTQRWPTLRLLTPNWQTRLPGHDYAGDDPDGFMPVADVVATLTRYARLVGAPVRTATTVHTVRAAPEGFEILANGCALADLKMNRFLTRADQWATTSGLDDELPPPHRFAPTSVDPRTPPGAGPDQRGGHHGAVGDRLPARPLMPRHPRA